MARPAKFERDDVLNKAMVVFWDHGYNATSMADLVAATALKSGSLYAAFQSKQDLFLEVLDSYGARSVASLEQALTEASSPLEGIRQYFQNLANDISGHGNKPSCLLVNTVLEVARDNAAVQARVNQHLDKIETVFRQALESAQRQGDLKPDADPGALASFLMCNIWGLRVLAGTTPNPDKIMAVVEQILWMIRQQ